MSKYRSALAEWTEGSKFWGRRVLGELATERGAVIIAVVALGESAGEQLCRGAGTLEVLSGYELLVSCVRRRWYVSFITNIVLIIAQAME